MPRPIQARIDLAAMRHNLEAARRRAAGRRIWAVIKANAYGHGIERAVLGFGAADGLALIDFEEARRARRAGWNGPLLMLEGLFAPEDIAACRELDLTAVVHSEAQLRMFEAAPPGPAVGVYIKSNTGMNRLGFEPREVAAVHARLARLPSVRVDGLSMHFANSDRVDAAAGPVSMNEQLQRFDAACRGLDAPRCISNSAALFLHPPLAEDWVRPGIALYGATPDSARPAESLGLRPAMTLATELIAVRTVAAGEAVGYGSRFVAQRATRIGVVACGYADGYPRHAPDGTPVAVGGTVVPMAGRVSMDMITVDLADAPDATVGTPVELWGAQVPIDRVAQLAGTVGYELMCALAPRVPVVAVG
ncbi:MAG TPA: alanine racemase [Burkholderiaceae bacterium]|nr:alanine racemase [Burkholderiaceae bacterium]